MKLLRSCFSLLEAGFAQSLLESSGIFAHDPVLRDPHADAAADMPLATNYVLTFTLFSDDKKLQQAELITARRSVSFDFVDDRSIRCVSKAS